MSKTKKETYFEELRRQRNRLSAAVRRQRRQLEQLRKRVDEQGRRPPSVYNVQLKSFM